jgi:hypothetical protein
MKVMIRRLQNWLKAFWQLGWKVSLLYAWYQFLIHSGLLKSLTPASSVQLDSKKEPPHDLVLLNLSLPSKENLHSILGDEVEKLINEANEIVEGKVRLFGSAPQPLNLKSTEQPGHWTNYSATWIKGQDIKVFWEAGRFGWATVLARAYRLSRNETYTETFWQYTEDFFRANPPNQGLHWASAQEVALRLITLVFCYHIFAPSPHTTPARVNLFKNALVAHANRIPPTLIYARAQNNNHLLTEAIGLYTAASVLADHPKSTRWRKLGWKWFNHAIQTQITSVGDYVQNSTNYHRLMLQAALWAAKITESQNEPLPEETSNRFSSATQWLLTLLDEESGKVPNLGANDGAYILPLTVCDFSDYRPVLQACGETFLGHKPFPDGPWNEMDAWLSPKASISSTQNPNPQLLRLDGKNSWAYVRAARSTNRHGHADQLHLDLWWRGLNVAQDAGTYLYNAPPPWENPLSSTSTHNTITINGQNQMTRAGRFLWLDWNQAKITPAPTRTHLAVEHNGYKKIGVTHQRSVELTSQHTWEITDKIIASHGEQIHIRLHWLLPDWEWKLDNTTLHLKSPHGWITLDVQAACSLTPSIIRAGELLTGEGQIEAYYGWISPTYNEKIPALSFAITTQVTPPITLVSKWDFPG